MIKKIVLVTTLVLSVSSIGFADLDKTKKSIEELRGFDSENIIKKGDKSEAVSEIQTILSRTGDFTFNRITGYFGNITEKAVMSFEERNGLTVDGVVDNELLENLRNINDEYSSRFGVLKNWWSDVRGKLINRGDIVEVEDFRTGIKFNVMITYGTNHADVESVTIEDTLLMKKVWGDFSWTRRPVILELNGERVAASMTFMPHAGLDDKAEGMTVNNRSAGFGRGYNYDKIKENGMDGHVDIHFYKSTRHMDGKQDINHQTSVKEAAGMKL